MMSFNSKKTAISVRIQKLVWGLGKRAFLLVLILLLFGIYFGQFLFYQYIFIANVQEPEVGASFTKFKEKEYQFILKSWTEREHAYENSPGGDYSDPFE